MLIRPFSFYLRKEHQLLFPCARDRSGNEAAECALFGGVRKRPCEALCTPAKQQQAGAEF